MSFNLMDVNIRLQIDALDSIDIFFFAKAADVMTDFVRNLSCLELEDSVELVLLNNQIVLTLYGLTILYAVVKNADGIDVQNLRMLAEFEPQVIHLASSQVVRHNKTLQVSITFRHKFKPIELHIEHTFFTRELSITIKGDTDANRISADEFVEFKDSLKNAIKVLQEEIKERIANKRYDLGSTSVAELLTVSYLCKLTNTEDFPI